ncbi:MAG: hypothetical protein EA378_11645 [Phycisphaerales bacterium]|nr:MAG: hypothetical protein EA378_11645 [Phycisphaerales bacterium]
MAGQVAGLWGPAREVEAANRVPGVWRWAMGGGVEDVGIARVRRVAYHLGPEADRVRKPGSDLPAPVRRG